MIEVLARIENEREMFAQKVPGAIGFNMGDWFNMDGADEELEVCGTVGCLAGHAVVLAGDDIMHMSGDQIANAGAKFLELDGPEDENEWSVFYLADLPDVYRWVARRMGIDEQVLRDKVQGERA